MKKLAIILLLFFIGFNSLTIDAKEGTDLQQKIKKQTEYLKEYSKILKKAEKDKDFEAFYGGTYFNDDDVLVINVLKGHKEKFKSKFDVAESIILKDVKHSYKEIQKAKKILDDLVYKGYIKSAGLSNENNALTVELFEDSLETKKVVKELSKIDSIIFEVQNSEMYITPTVSVAMNGTGATGGVTIGFAAYNSSGEDGFVTVGHTGYSEGKDIYCEGSSSKCGDIESIDFGQEVDGAFVKLTSTWKPTRSFDQGSYYDSVVTNTSTMNNILVEGAYVRAYGNTSGEQSGQIIDTDFSTFVEGTYITHFVKADYMAIGGDSGAAVTTYYYSGGPRATKYVIGIQSASLLDQNREWIDDVSFSLFSRSDYIMEHFSLSVYH